MNNATAELARKLARAGLHQAMVPVSRGSSHLAETRSRMETMQTLLGALAVVIEGDDGEVDLLTLVEYLGDVRRLAQESLDHVRAASL